MMLRIRPTKATTCLPELNFSMVTKQARTIACVFAHTHGIDVSNAALLRRSLLFLILPFL